MRLPGIDRLRKPLRRAFALFRPAVAILAYHRVFEAPLDLQHLCVESGHFSEHLEYLQKHYSVLSLKELVQDIKEGQIPKRAVVVTFDDGYADNLWYAKPLLERYQIPATVFVTTGYIGAERGFWWDELERLLLYPKRLPEMLNLSINGRTYQWELKEVSHYSGQMDQHHSGWNVEEEDSRGSRLYLYGSLHQLLRPLPEEERQNVLDELLAWSDAEPKEGSSQRTLSQDEVVRLEGGGLVEVGCHTVTHPVLSTLPAAAQRHEIQQSKISLEKILGHRVSSFAYPYGSRSDYSMEAVTIVRESGLGCACSCFSGVVWQNTDLLQLPRFLVRDWNGREFAWRLKDWFCD